MNPWRSCIRQDKGPCALFLVHLPGCIYVSPYSLKAFFSWIFAPGIVLQFCPREDPHHGLWILLSWSNRHHTKIFFLVESCAEVSVPFLCLNAVFAGLVWTRLVVPGANAALRGRKIHWCGAFSCIGTRNWCLAVIPHALTATASVADQGHGDIWDTVGRSGQNLLQAFCFSSARIFTQVRKGEQTFANESPTDPSLDKASEWVFKLDLEDLATS